MFVKKIKVYNESKCENSVINQGEIIRIKSFLKNLGKKTASDVIVSFYHDSCDTKNLIGTKTYESIGKYQKYPSILFDTINLKPGKHKIIVIADEKDEIEEIFEFNNRLFFQIRVVDTRPSFSEKNIVISDSVSYTHLRAHET